MGWDRELRHRCPLPADVDRERLGHTWTCDHCGLRWWVRAISCQRDDVDVEWLRIPSGGAGASAGRVG